MHPDDVEDVEVIEDIKEYKRSLRVFKYFEDQEKLALEEEYEEVVAAWRRQGAGRRKPNHEQVEEANLLHRPLVFSQIRRIPTRHSQCTKPCGLCRTPVAAPAGVIGVDALVPIIRKIDIDEDDEDADDGQIQMRNCTAKPKGRVSTRSADLTLKVQMTRSQLRELQHSLTFVDEYAAGLLT